MMLINVDVNVIDPISALLALYKTVTVTLVVLSASNRKSCVRALHSLAGQFGLKR